jgi:hypothetical protein
VVRSGRPRPYASRWWGVHSRPAGQAATIALTPDVHSTLGKVQVFFIGTAAASFFAMQFTGSTTFTSPSGVEWEMRRALAFQVGAVVLAGGIALVRALIA